MEEYENEKLIIGHAEPISFKRLDELKVKSQNSTCIINCLTNIGTGFFFKQNIKNIPFYNKYFLITCYHVINFNLMNNNNKELLIIYKNNKHKIQLINKRIKLSNEELDYKIIEILKTDEIFKKIKDKDYFELDNFIMDNESQINYMNLDICIVQYPDGKDLSFAQGKINIFKNYKIYHSISTKKGSSGSPILIQNNFKVIGIHKGGINNKDENIGIFFKDILNDFKNFKVRPGTSKVSNKKIDFVNDYKNIQLFHNPSFNYNKKINDIICEYNINNKNNVQILNCYEEVKKNNTFLDWNIINDNGNEIEIKENCQIYLNEKPIYFSFKKNFENEGKNIIKIILKNPLTYTNFMFCNCFNLISLDLSNFNTINVKDMSYMFYYCPSLTFLNLSNYNTNNVSDMSYMFYKCSSLTSLNLSNFKTNKVNNMRYMFSNCSNLTSLDLSNFNTINVKDMSYMFFDCNSLNSLQIKNFNTNNVNNMNNMFSHCCSLTSLNISNFNTNNVNNMNNMFFYCSSLISLDLSNFNTINVKDIANIFTGLNKNAFIITNDILLKEIIASEIN